MAGKHSNKTPATTSQDKPAGSIYNSIPFNQQASPGQKAKEFDRQHHDSENSSEGRKGQ